MNQSNAATNAAAKGIQESDLIVHKESFYRELDKKIENSRKVFKKAEIVEMIATLKREKGNIHIPKTKMFIIC